MKFVARIAFCVLLALALVASVEAQVAPVAAAAAAAVVAPAAAAPVAVAPAAAPASAAAAAAPVRVAPVAGTKAGAKKGGARRGAMVLVCEVDTTAAAGAPAHRCHFVPRAEIAKSGIVKKTGASEEPLFKSPSLANLNAFVTKRRQQRAANKAAGKPAGAAPAAAAPAARPAAPAAAAAGAAVLAPKKF